MKHIFSPTVSMRNGKFIIPKNKKTGKIITDLQEMEQAKREGVLLQEMITTTDTKEFFTQGINTFLLKQPDDADTQWRNLFTEIPSRGPGELFPFRDSNVAGTGSHGIVFEEVGEGGEIKYSTVTSNEKYIKNIKYGTALKYSNEWMEDGSLGLVEMYTRDFRDAAWDKLAAIHYGVIVQAVATGISHQAAVAGATLDDFITAINDAVAIMRRNKRTPDYLCVAPEQEDIALRTAHDVYRDTNPSIMTESAKRLTILVSDHFAAGTAYIIQSKRWLISTNREELTLGKFSDLIHDAETIVGKFGRGAALGDGKAVRAITGLT